MTDLNRPPDVLAAIQRTIEAEGRLKNDLVRICCWVEERHSIQPVKIELQRHHGCADNEVAHVVPLVRDQSTRRAIRSEAETVLKAIGWIVKPEGRDIRSFYGRTQGLSQHDRLRYYSEIGNIFRSVQVKGAEDL